MEEQKHLMIIGFGPGGRRAAESLRQSRAGFGATLVLAGGDLPDGGAAHEHLQLSEILEPSGEQLSQIIRRGRLVVLTADLGGGVEEALLAVARRCREQSKPCLAVVTLPFSQSDTDARQAADSAYADLLEESDLAIGLDLDLLATCLPDQAAPELDKAAARWLLECTRGVLAPMLPTTAKTPGKGAEAPGRGGLEQLSLELAEMSLGIFCADNPSQYHGQNYDIPTFQRKGVKINR
ncbi:MAG: hypothetical protein PHC30_04825 [Lentisphaeria bacterium]|nr:hypothetical protein [Lentisphaeria bacterium]